MRLIAILVALALLVFSVMFSYNSQNLPVAAEHQWTVSGNLELVGHSALLRRGMNSAIAIVGDYAYVGSRTEGETHKDSGVLVVDIADPSNPRLVGQIGQPDESLYGISSRELRGIPEKNTLIVLNFSCSTWIHDCHRDEERFPNTGGVAEGDNLKFYDLSNPTKPQLISTYFFGTYPGSGLRDKPHEFYMWRDPKDSDRILLFFATPGGPPSLEVLDISDIHNVRILAQWDGRDDANLEESPGAPHGAHLHSLALSEDGRTAYLAYEGAGFFMVDTSEIAENLASPEIKLLTPIENRVDYSPPHPPGNHSAVKVPNRDLVITTDEIYPAPILQGCPWGWMRVMNIEDVRKPFIQSEFKLPENNRNRCPDDKGPEWVSYTSHNPTVTENLVLVTWHSGGFRIVDISDASNPKIVGVYMPKPLSHVQTEDPALGGHPVAMWSYPIIRNGLIYVIDLRNGLYILKYSGPHRDEIDGLNFYEGNSNLR
jgi:hypothetical protein